MIGTDWIQILICNLYIYIYTYIHVYIMYTLYTIYSFIYTWIYQLFGDAVGILGRSNHCCNHHYCGCNHHEVLICSSLKEM